MSREHVEILQAARENFVRKRRHMAEQMMPSGAAGAHFAPSFAEIQLAIEALDRAIQDEQRLPGGYASEEPLPEPRTGGSNVEHVDFDAAR
jgi:hypothetical protein